MSLPSWIADSLSASGAVIRLIFDAMSNGYRIRDGLVSTGCLDFTYAPHTEMWGPWSVSVSLALVQ